MSRNAPSDMPFDRGFSASLQNGSGNGIMDPNLKIPNSSTSKILPETSRENSFKVGGVPSLPPLSSLTPNFELHQQIPPSPFLNSHIFPMNPILRNPNHHLAPSPLRIEQAEIQGKMTSKIQFQKTPQKSTPEPRVPISQIPASRPTVPPGQTRPAPVAKRQKTSSNTAVPSPGSVPLVPPNQQGMLLPSNHFVETPTTKKRSYTPPQTVVIDGPNFPGSRNAILFSPAKLSPSAPVGKSNGTISNLTNQKVNPGGIVAPSAGVNPASPTYAGLNMTDPTKLTNSGGGSEGNKIGRANRLGMHPFADFVRFIVNPVSISGNDFTIPFEIDSKLSTIVEQLSRSDKYRRLSDTEQPVQIQISCFTVQLSKDRTQPQMRQNSNRCVLIYVNGKMIQPRAQYYCVNLNRYLLKGKNTIRITATNQSQQNNGAEPALVAQIQLMRCYSAEDLLNRIKKAPSPSKSELIEQIKRSFSTNSEIQQISYMVSLRCPITKQRMQYPGRSQLCNHIQCFDLFNFLSISLRTLRVKWLCPICSKALTLDVLFLDSYFQDVLEGVKDSPQVHEVEVMADGNWNVPSSTQEEEIIIDLTDDSLFENQNSESVKLKEEQPPEQPLDSCNNQPIDAIVTSYWKDEGLSNQTSLNSSSGIELQMEPGTMEDLARSSRNPSNEMELSSSSSSLKLTLNESLDLDLNEAPLDP